MCVHKSNDLHKLTALKYQENLLQVSRRDGRDIDLKCCVAYTWSDHYMTIYIYVLQLLCNLSLRIHIYIKTYLGLINFSAMMFSYYRIELNSPFLYIYYSVQKWKEEKLIVLVEKHKAMCETMCLLFIQTNIWTLFVANYQPFVYIGYINYVCTILIKWSNKYKQ